MGINNKISEGYAYFLTLTIEEWIDVFSRPVYKHIIVDSLNYCIANKEMNYIHNNPVKAELVGRAEDYLYSSARDYAGEKGLVELIMV